MVTVFKGIENFTNFLYNWVNSGRSLVSQDQANERGATCVTCHNNVNVDQAVQVGCCGRGAMSVINSFVTKIIQNRTTPNDGNLRSCGLCGCNLRVKVWIPIEAIGVTKEDSNAYPTFCYIKKELEAQP